MKYFIASRLGDKYLVVHRFKNIGITINKEMFFELWSLVQKERTILPNWVIELFRKLEHEYLPGTLKKILLIREPTIFHFQKSSFEITEKCNFRCRHCYLGKKIGKELPLKEKKKILDIIKASGALWLQITGGEPLISKDFLAIYRHAYSLGFLITISTNGSLLHNKSSITNTLSSLPPYRVAVSVYGATTSSYETLTQETGSFLHFRRALIWLRDTGVRTRLNIIITRYNEKEIGRMKALAESFGFEYHVYPQLSPTLTGDTTPITLRAESCEKIKMNESYEKQRSRRCNAGQTFFHVNWRGMASICKVGRDPHVDLLQKGVQGLKELPFLAEKLLSPLSLCKICKFKENCFTCPPMLRLYQRSGVVPSNICRKISNFNSGKGGE